MIRLLIGGSPCTHWSVAQTKNRETQPNSGLGWELFLNYKIALEKWKPDYFLYENNKSASQAIKNEIAKELNISTTTVIFHRNNISEKLKTRSLGRLTIYAVLNNIVSLSEIQTTTSTKQIEGLSASDSPSYFVQVASISRSRRTRYAYQSLCSHPHMLRHTNLYRPRRLPQA